MPAKFADDPYVFQLDRAARTDSDFYNRLTDVDVNSDNLTGITPSAFEPVNYVSARLPEHPLRLTLHIEALPHNYDVMPSNLKQFWEWMVGLHVYQIDSVSNDSNYSYKWVGRLPYNGTPTFTTKSNLPVKSLISNFATPISPIVNNEVVINRTTSIQPSELAPLYPKYIRFLQLVDRSPIADLLEAAYEDSSVQFDTWFDANKSELLSLIPETEEDSDELIPLREQIGDSTYRATEDLFPFFYNASEWALSYPVDRPRLHVGKDDTVTPVYKQQFISPVPTFGFFGVNFIEQYEQNYYYLSRRYVETDNNAEVKPTDVEKVTAVQIPRPHYNGPVYLYSSYDPKDYIGTIYPHHA